MALFSPFQGALVHLLLIGIPVGFGFYQIGPFGDWLGIPSPCSMYQAYHHHPEEGEDDDDDDCPPLEKFMIQDLGYRFVLHYELAIVAVFILGQQTKGDNEDTTCSSSTLAMRRFHRTLISTSFWTMLGMVWLQYVGGFEYRDAAAAGGGGGGGGRTSLNSDFFFLTVVCYLLAIALSTWVSKPTTLPWSSKKPAKWSVPGMALLVGVVVNAMVAIASVQLLLTPNGLSPYIASSSSSSSSSFYGIDMVPTTVALSTLHTIVHMMILKSIRDIMTVSQLRWICLYKTILNVVLPLCCWRPESSDFIQLAQHSSNQSVVLPLRIVLTTSYFCGYVFAGMAEPVGRILGSEKEV